MCSLDEHYLKARFRWNQSNELREGYSTLVHFLEETEWVPQKDGDSISFVCPCDASIERLPEGFQYVPGQKWLEAIKFGEFAEERKLAIADKKSEESDRNQDAKEMGFNSGDEAKAIGGYTNELRGLGKSPEKEIKKLVDKSTAKEQRKERLLIKLSDAEEKQYEIRARSISVTRGKIHPRTHLRAQYTELNNVECQMCRQDMPFKKRNSDEDYFEAVEALKKDHFPKEHEAQYLSLCPECAAKYKEFVKRDKKVRENLYNALKSSDEPEIQLELGDFEIRIWFKEKHWHDLQTVLDYYEKEGS